VRKYLSVLFSFHLLVLCAGCGESSSEEPRIVVLGVDGLDPAMLTERIERGLCPNLGQLVAEGTFAALGTSWPPQSPVAWSNFITGVNPGRHGLFDFVHPNRANYGVQNSMSATEEVGLELSLFGYRLPLTGGNQVTTRDFPAFWDVMADAGVPVTVCRIPAAFPLEDVSDAVVFPDMGTPDITGAAAGKATLWTEKQTAVRKDGESTRTRPIELDRSRMDGGRGTAKVNISLQGPDDTLIDLQDLEEDLRVAEKAGDMATVLRLRARMARERESTQPGVLWLDMTSPESVLAVEINDNFVLAGVGEWTDWIPVEFPMLGGAMNLAGWTRFLFSGTEPFEVYAAPIQIDPWNPAMPVSSPEEASAELADAIGPYYTQGFPDAYKAYKAGLLDTPNFVSQSDTVMEEREAMLDWAMDGFERDGGVLFFYVGSLDLRCHMLWFAQDANHPHKEDGVTENHGDEIDRIYSQVDAMVGRLVDRLRPNDQFMVISDHGFAPFRRKMHVNDWLVEKGWLVLKDGAEVGNFRVGAVLEDGSPDPESSIVDWGKTKAWCVGFNGIHLNRVGREGLGIVTEEESDALLTEISEALLQEKDRDGTPVFHSVKRATKVFSGPHVSDAPDLQLGFARGYGASDECAVGEITGEGNLVDNDSRWSGSHLMAPEVVPGVFLCRESREIASNPRLRDITATLYKMVGVTPPDGMDGYNIFNN